MNRRGLLAGASLVMASGAAASADAEDEALLRGVLRDFASLIHARDMAVIDRFTPDLVLIGSEAGEHDRGRAELAAHVAQIYAAPVRLSWTWDVVDGQVLGDFAWLLAQGWIVTETAEGASARKPYRLSGALVKKGGGWLWKMFHGSEPIA